MDPHLQQSRIPALVLQIMFVVRKMLKIFAGLLIVLGISIGISFVYLQTHYADTLPREPKQSEGRVHLLNVHGTIVYLTESEKSRLLYFQIGALVCGICGGFLWIRK